jgi:hypothetical protein
LLCWWRLGARHISKNHGNHHIYKFAFEVL